MQNNDAKTGRFTKGNKAAAGNPYTKKAAELRRALYSSIDSEKHPILPFSLSLRAESAQFFHCLIQ